MMLLFSTFLFSIGSALLPILNAEAYVAVASTHQPEILVSLVAAGGQMVGKAIWYYAGAHADKLPALHRRMERPKLKAGLEKWRARSEGRPIFTHALLFASASLGVPPYAVMAILAGVLRVNVPLFLLSGFVGRFLRFWAVAAASTSLWGLLVAQLR